MPSLPSPLSIWLTSTERKAILEHALMIYPAAEKAISQATKSLPVALLLRGWKDLAESLLAASNPADTPKLKRALTDTIRVAVDTEFYDRRTLLIQTASRA